MGSSFEGPTFRFVEEVPFADFRRGARFGAHPQPLLVKGAVRQWPAWERWSFDQLAALRRRDGSEVVTSFQNGLVEQGITAKPLDLPITPYLRELAQQAREHEARDLDEVGLMPARRRRELAADARFRLDWSHMRSFEANRVYLAQWHILDDFPAMRRDFQIRTLWPGAKLIWEYVFIGPSQTVTGLHYDWPNNWFCQVRGTKEVILFAPDQSEHLSPSRKYDWGAQLSDVNIAQLDRQPQERERFARAQGWYATVEAGDALFIPARHWHAVVARTPSVSLGVFGLTPWEVIAGGSAATARDLLHKMRLYRWGNCTCHEMPSAAPTTAIE